MIKYWYLLITSLILFVVFPVNIYLCRQLRKIKYIKEMKNKYLSWFISLIFLLLTIILFIWNTTNGYVIMLHIFFVVLLGEIIYKLVRSITKKEYKYGQEITLIASILVVFLYLGYGYYMAHHVVETHYEVIATKDIGVDRFRIVQVTDSHIGATMNGEDFYNYMLKINDTKPDIVVVTGDFIDDETTKEDFIKACSGLGVLDTNYGVYFVYGNHDEGYTRNNDGLREELLKNNVTILEDEGLDITGNIYLLGRKDKRYKDRFPIKDLVKDIDTSKYIIDLNHQPNDYKNEEGLVDLVISGHTHGGQMFPLQYIDLSGNNQMYGIEQRGNTTFIVSSGIGDWAVKFKTIAKAEYVVIDIINNN